MCADGSKNNIKNDVRRNKKKQKIFSNSCAKNLAITNKNIISGETGKIVSGGAAADCKAARAGKKKSAKNVPGK